MKRTIKLGMATALIVACSTSWAWGEKATAPAAKRDRDESRQPPPPRERRTGNRDEQRTADRGGRRTGNRDERRTGPPPGDRARPQDRSGESSERRERPRSGNARTSEEEKRYIELKKKQPAKLTTAEKTELGRLEAKQGPGAEEARGRGRRPPPSLEERRAARREVLREHPEIATDSKAQAEQRRHAERLAKLERAREVATEAGRDDLVQRIDALETKERARHSQWWTNRRKGGN